MSLRQRTANGAKPAGGGIARGLRFPTKDTTMRAANWGVVLYIVAALAAISIPLALTAVTGAAAQLAPQPSPDDLLGIVRAILPTYVALH